MSIARFLGPGSPIQPFVRQDLAWGINQARRNGADVLNLSWGHDALQGTYIVDAIDSAVRFGRDGLGSVVVGISQNDGNTNAPHVRFPATLQNVIAVGAIDRNGRRANFSNFGPQLDVVAPGVDIRTTAVNNSYTFIDGTSFAAPHVAGIAALILSVRPDLSS
jgi:subtilisin family serine protease